MNINDEIQNLIDNINKEFKVPTYVYNNYDKFIPGVTPIYYSGPFFDDKELIEGIKSLLVGKWMSAGEKVKEFEHAFSRKINQHFSVMVNSGSSANLIAIASMKHHFGWEDGSEIIISVVGFPTTYAPMIQNNLILKFVDIEMDTLNFDVDLIESKISNKTKAIVLSPVLGNVPDLDRILEICKQYNLELFLDNCDSLGTTWNGKQLPEYARISTASFYASHHITTYEGGMVSSNTRDIMHIARSLTNWGKGCICSGVENLLPNGICNHRFDYWLPEYDGLVDHRYTFFYPGYNLKPLEFSGAVGLVQLEKLPNIIAKRKYNKKRISDIFLKYIPNIKIPKSYPEADVSWFGTPFICESKEQKNKLVSYLEGLKVQTRRYFSGNLLLHEGYKNLGNFRDYPVANRVLDEVFFIGCSPHYTEDHFNYFEDILSDYK